MSAWKNISLWMDQLDSFDARPELENDCQVDVAIMGAGFTGLWTAYYLKKQQSDLNVVILESEVAGFGASGRNGGWLMGQISGQDSLLEGSDTALKKIAHEILHDIPEEVARVIKQEKIKCDYKKGGVLYVAARYAEQKYRLREHFQKLQEAGYSEQDYEWLNTSKLAKKLNIPSSFGAIFSPHCATIQPAKLVRGLADAVEALGVRIYEKSPVTTWRQGELTTNKARVTAKWIVPALEAYGAQLPTSLKKLNQYHLPVQSLIIATEPLSDEQWKDIGLANGEAFADNSRQVTYGIRSDDNRLVFGARGTYQFGAKLREDFQLTPQEIEDRRRILVELFPQLHATKITHAWGGNLAVSRRFAPHMIKDEQHGFVLSGGYGGEGVGATNLAGRTLADLILGNESNLIKMPWVKAQGTFKDLAKWESEPLPWLGYKIVIKAFDFEDKVLTKDSATKWQRYLAEKVADTFEKIVQ